jgi:hypothetical protein
VSPRGRNTYHFPNTSFLNVGHLLQLRHKAPDLVTLDLDVYIAKEWTYELWDTLASFTELENLTLRFEAQSDDWDDWDDCDSDEYAEYSSVGEFRTNENELTLMMGLKAYLRKRKVGKPFKQLETWVGSELMKDIEELC